MPEQGFPGYPPNPSNVGAQFSGATIVPVTDPVHHVISTAVLATITPPGLPGKQFIGPLYLVADSLFSWTTTGNIAAPPGTTLVLGVAVGFVYDTATSKWYPMAGPLLK